MLDSCASATRFSASALTSSCSRTTSLALSGSFILSFEISSAILSFPSRLGWTLFSVLRMDLRQALESSRAWAYESSSSPISERTTPILSEMSLMASSLVCSPHSESCVAMVWRSRPAASWAWIRLFSDLMTR